VEGCHNKRRIKAKVGMNPARKTEPQKARSYEEKTTKRTRYKHKRKKTRTSSEHKKEKKKKQKKLWGRPTRTVGGGWDHEELSYRPTTTMGGGIQEAAPAHDKEKIEHKTKQKKQNLTQTNRK